MNKILFINPPNSPSIYPHPGYAMLSAMLKQKGHEVLVADYPFCDYIPAVEKIITNFKPDVVGFSLYTATMGENKKQLDKQIDIVCQFDIPIIVGGPHTLLYSDDLCLDNRLDYIVVGYAEDIIVNLVENAKHEDNPVVILSHPPDPKILPFPNFTSFYDYEKMWIYSLLTSRGCPFNCSFCLNSLLSSKKWRPRDPKNCIEELKFAKKTLPNLTDVMIFDDCFNLDINHAKKFLKLYLKESFDFNLHVAYFRADRIDEELISLYKEAGGTDIEIGVEHGDPEVFKEISKGETLNDIVKAAKLIKENGLELGLTFIIGLPKDSLEKTHSSIKFAKSLDPNFVNLQMLVPYKGTRVYDYFKERGKFIRNNPGRSAQYSSMMCVDSCVETSDFTAEERKKAYYIFLLEIDMNRFNLTHLYEILPHVIKYLLFKELYHWLKRNYLEKHRLTKELYHLLKKNTKIG